MVATKLVYLHYEGRKRIYSLPILKIFLFTILINCITANDVRRLDGSVSTVLLVVDGVGGIKKLLVMISNQFLLKS